jgi:PAS domain S-box-containing protein
MAVKLLSNSTGVKQNGNGFGYSGIRIADIISNGFFKVDRQWTVRYWNKAAEKILGVASKNIVGKNIWDIFAGSLPKEFCASYRNKPLQDIPAHFEEYWPEIGSWFDVVTYYFDDNLSVSFKSHSQSAHSNHEDHPEQQLKVLNELYRFVTEVTNDCLWEWDLQHKEQFWIDGGHKRVFGYPIENTLVPQGFWEELLHPDDKERIFKKLTEVLARHGDSWEVEYRFKKADGTYAFVQDRAHIFYDENNSAATMIGATQDITARKSADIQLLESEKKLSLIAKQTVNAVIITDAEERIMWVNNAFTRITEYEPEEVIGRKPGSFLQGKETDALTVQYLSQKMRDKQPFNCEIVNYSKSGRKYWVHVQGQPIWDEDGICSRFFAIETDITEKIAMENELMEERLSKQKEITTAVLNAHENERTAIGKELHDNLNQILGAAKLYIEMAKTDEEVREMCLDRSSGYIMKVIEEIRKISKTLASPSVHLMGLIESIRNVIDDLVVVHPIRIEFHENGIVEKELEERLQLDILRIVQEQLNNIIKHANATLAIIHLNRKENEITLVISDNGEGCDTSIEKLGVGLINIRSRAEANHGWVTIASRLGEGYMLKVILHPAGIVK